MEDQIVRATGIHKTYDTGQVKVNALRGVDLTVQRGEMVAIMGPSGCGKTTMLNCLSGLDDIDEGQVTIDGVVLHDLPDDERSDYRARSMGFVFQLYNLLLFSLPWRTWRCPCCCQEWAPPRRGAGPSTCLNRSAWQSVPATFQRTVRRAASKGHHRSSLDQQAIHHLGG